MKIGEKFKRSDNSEKQKLTPRKLLTAGLLGFALASAGCEIDEHADISPESKAKIDKIIKPATVKAAKTSLALYDKYPYQGYLYDDKKGRLILSLFVKNKHKFADIGTYEDERTIDIEMKKIPGTKQPDPNKVYSIYSKSALRDTNLKGKRTTHDGILDIRFEGGHFNAISDISTSVNGRVNKETITGYDTLYPISGEDSYAIEHAHRATNDLTRDLNDMRDSLEDFSK